MKRPAAVALFKALGLKNPDKWDNDRMSAKLQQLPAMIDEDVKLEGDEKASLDAVMKAVKDGEKIEVEDEEEAPAAAPPEEPKKEESNTVGDVVREEQKEQEAKKEQEPEKLPDGREKGELRKEPPHGVRVGRTTPWFCGEVIRRHGIDAGITDEMVREVDDMRGKNNPDQIRADLSYCWHAINGYTHAFETGPKKT